MPDRLETAPRWAAPACLLGAWAGFAAFAVSLLPADTLDIYYMRSLEEGGWGSPEWMHPLWIPLLSVYQALLRALGYHGKMLVPVELLNVAISCATGLLLFRVARSVAARPLVCAVASLYVLTISMFWSAAIRPTPYALAFLLVVATLDRLAADEPPLITAGLLAGLATSLHASSSVGLGAAALVVALRRPRARLWAFGASASAVVLVALLIFCARNHLGARQIFAMNFHEEFSKIEQVPQTSIFTSHSWAAQLRTLLGGVLMIGSPLAVMAALAAAAGRRAPRTPLTGRERTLLTVALANFAGFALFFLVLNSRNGFIFAALALAPPLLVLPAARSRAALLALALALPPLLAVVAVVESRGGITQGHDPILREQRFLASLLGPRDLVLTPGCPFPDVRYFAPLNLVAISPAAPLRCESPSLRIGDVLRARVQWWSAHGSRVFLALGDQSTDFAVDVSGDEKQHQIFWTPQLGAQERRSSATTLRASLDSAGLRLGAVHDSPGGERYLEVSARDLPPALPPPVNAPELASLRERFTRRYDFPATRAARQLEELAAAVPGDPWSACDRARLAFDHGGAEPPAGCD
jgi:hypothetical protein